MTLSELTRRLIAFVIAAHCKALDRDCKKADASAERAKRQHFQAIAVADQAYENEAVAERQATDAKQRAAEIAANAVAERSKYGY